MERAGEPIPGSRYVRAFCRSCGEPMRVSAEIFRLGAYDACSTCDPPEPSEATLRAAAKYAGPTDGDDDPWWHIAVEALRGPAW